MGKNLAMKEARKEKGLSQDALATAVGVSRQTINALEIRVRDLVPEFLADALVFGGLLQAAGAVAVLGLQALLDHFDDFGVGVELDFGHGNTSYECG